MRLKPASTNVICHAEADPEQRLIAALITQAISDARAGDAEAVAWLAESAGEWLPWITPDSADPSVVHARLLARIGAGR